MSLQTIDQSYNWHLVFGSTWQQKVIENEMRTQHIMEKQVMI